MFLELRVF